jgi:branched-chain amino acid transport system permease protein
MRLLSQYDTLLVLSVMAYGIALLGLNLLFGQGGLLSFGHALFLALGAYAAAFCTSRWGIRDVEMILALSAGAAAVVAAPVGALCVRYTRIHFSMLTLAFGMLFWSFLLRFSDLTGGDQGMPVLQPRLLGREWSTGDNLGFLTGPYLAYVAGVLLLLGVLMRRMVGSPFGLALRATRDNPLKASALGVGVAGVRWAGFVISAMYGAIGGALLAPVSGLADPTLAYWTQSGFLVFMVILGGYRRFLGPLVGAAAFVFLQDRVQAALDAWRLALGALLVVIVVLAPEGLAGLSRHLRLTLPRKAAG